MVATAAKDGFEETSEWYKKFLIILGQARPLLFSPQKDQDYLVAMFLAKKKPLRRNQGKLDFISGELHLIAPKAT